MKLHSSGPDRARLWWTIAIVAFAIRLAAALATDGLRHPELNEYDSLARAMLAGRGFTYQHINVLYHSYAPPMDSWIAAASYWLSGTIVLKMLLQLVAGSALAVLTAAIAERLFAGWLAPAVAGLLVAVHPGLVVYNATKSHPLTFDALFFTLTLLQVFRLAERQTIGRAIELGAIVGIGTLSRGTTVIFLPVAALWLLITASRPTWPAVIRNSIVAGICAAAIIAPWTIRNSRLHHQFVFLLTTDSEDFWRGNNPYATGHSYIDAEHIVLRTLSADERRDLENQPDEIAQARWFHARSFQFITEQPDQFVRLTLLKFFHFWWFAPQTGVLYPGSWLYAYAAYYAGALVLALAGLLSVLRRGRAAVSGALLIGAFLLALSGLQSLYYVEGRHRWAIEPMLLVFSGGGAAAVVDASRRRTQAAVHLT